MDGTDRIPMTPSRKLLPHLFSTLNRKCSLAGVISPCPSLTGFAIVIDVSEIVHVFVDGETKEGYFWLPLFCPGKGTKQFIVPKNREKALISFENRALLV
ncbi:MAG: hypothetical protein JRE40_10485 [Deltaproteobacteria bacterium]|nr:hypothetical protein [Deltaproteobacteria bacterium]